MSNNDNSSNYKKIILKLISSLFMGAFFGLGLFITYATSITSISSTYNTGDTLGVEWFNDLKTKIVPAGFVGAFNLSSCPTGWIAANGSNGTPDLRGEFIRGLDSGRGVDSGRILSSSQTESYKTHAHYISTSDIFNTAAFILNDHSGDQIASSDNAPTSMGEIKTNRYYTETSGGTETRPRNVALLYCVKQ